MAITKFKILKDFTTGGPVKEDSQVYFKVNFKKGEIVEGEEVENPDYKIGLVGAGAPKAVKVVTPSGTVLIKNNAALGPDNLFIEPYTSALPEGLPEVGNKKESEITPATTPGKSTASSYGGMSWALKGIIAGGILGAIVGLLAKKQGAFAWYYMILTFVVIGGLGGSLADNKMKKVALYGRTKHTTTTTRR